MIFNGHLVQLGVLLPGKQSSCLENPMDGGAWWAVVHGVAKSQTWLSDFTFTFHFYALEKEMATHSSVLAWRIPGTAEPGGLLSMGSHRVGHDWNDLAAAAAAAVQHSDVQNLFNQFYVISIWVVSNFLLNSIMLPQAFCFNCIQNGLKPRSYWWNSKVMRKGNSGFLLRFPKVQSPALHHTWLFLKIDPWK